jgi:DNA repair exonuclease SbcCD ATPase subunit
VTEERRRPDPIEELAAIYAQRRGVPVSDALALVSALASRREDSVERLKRYLEALKAGVDVFSGIPPSVAQAIAPLLFAGRGDGEDDDLDLRRLVATATVLKSVLGDPSQELQYKLLSQILDRLLSQPQQQPPQEPLSYQLVSELAERLDRIHAALQQAPQQQQQQGFGDLLAQIEQLRKAAELLGMKPRDELAEKLAERLEQLERRLEQLASQPAGEAGQRLSPADAVRMALDELEKARQVLEQLGYRVERVQLSPLELERMLKQREEELRRRLEKEMEVERERINAVKEIILAAIREVGAQFTRALADAQREALRYRVLQRMAERQAAPQPQALGQAPQQPTPQQRGGGGGGVEGGGGAGEQG